MLPVISTERAELQCMTEYVDIIHESDPNYDLLKDTISLGDSKVRRTPIVVVTRYHTFAPGEAARPLIIIGSNENDDIAEPIIRRYSDISTSPWDRLTQNQVWIYHDLHYLFNKWDRVYSSAKLNLSLKTMEVQRRGATTSLLGQTQQFHMDTDTVMGLRELLRIHLESMEIIAEELSTMTSSGTPNGTKWHPNSGLCQRMQRFLRLFKFIQVTATEIVEQQRNLLSLAFSLETVMQGQAVARLNALAFVFLPLSFVASIFGITTFTASPKWYPAVALPLLLTTIAVAYILDKFLSSPHTRKLHTKKRRPSPITRTSQPASPGGLSSPAFPASTAPQISLSPASPRPFPPASQSSQVLRYNAAIRCRQRSLLVPFLSAYPDHHSL